MAGTKTKQRSKSGIEGWAPAPAKMQILRALANRGNDDL